MAPALHYRHAAPLIRIAKYLLLGLALVAAAALLAGYWLLYTTPGSRWAWERTGGLIPGNLAARSVEGSFGRGLILRGVTYSSEAVAVEAAEARLSASFVLFPLTVDVDVLSARDVLIRQFETPPPEEPEEPVLEKLALPVPVNFERVAAEGLRFVGSDGETRFVLNRGEFSGRWHEEISLTQLEVDSNFGNLSGAVRLGFPPPHTLVASVVAAWPFEAVDHTLAFSADADGNLADLAVEMSAADPAVRVSGRLFELLSEPRWDLQVRSPYIQWPLAEGADRDAAFYLREADFATSGRVTAYRLSGSGRISIAGTDELPFTVASDGNTDGLDVSELQLQGEAVDASAAGKVGWGQGFSVAVLADIGRFSVHAFLPEWPQEHPLAGTVDASWSTAGRVALRDVRLQVRNSPAALEASGEVDIDAGVVDLDLDWNDLQWPLRQDGPAGEAEAGPVMSEFGKVSVAGSPEEWRFDGRMAFQAADLPQGVFVLSGLGNRESVDAVLHESAVLDGSVSGRASFNWTGEKAWQADLVTERINIGALAPEAAGQISSDFSARGQLEPLAFDVRFERLHGVLRQRELEGQGGFRYADGSLRADSLRLRSGDSHLRLDGNPRSGEGLDFSIEIPSLEAFQAEVAGALSANGNLSISGQFPSLDLELHARNLLWNEYGLEELSVTRGDAPGSAPVSLQAVGQGLSLGTRTIQGFRVGVTASEARQELDIVLSPGEEGRVGIELAGQVANWRRPLESGWEGRLRAATIVAPQGTQYRLDEPAGIQVSADSAAVDQACLQGEDRSRVCIGGHWRSGDFRLDADLAAVPMSLLDLVYDTELELTQELGGSLSLSSEAGGPLSGEGRIDISPGRIQNRLEPRIAAATGPGRFSFSLSEGERLSAQLSLPFANEAEVSAELSVANIGMGRQSPVDGRLIANLNDIAFAATVVPMVDGMRGRVDVDMALAGTLEDPQVTGDASLTDAALRYDPLGLELSNVRLRASLDANNEIDLESTFNAGEGRGELRSRAQSINGLRDGLQLALTGEDLTLIDVPDVNVVADTNLNIGYRDSTLSLNGNVLVSRARIRPTTLATGKVSESEDVRIVANEDEAATPEPDNGPPIQLNGTVALALGNDVVVDLDVAEARLQGTTAFTWRGPPVPVGNGQYTVQGKFEAYGQLLDITEGRIQFPGTSAANPTLRIRAERDIFGNPQINSAGVLVTGTAQDPSIEVYTNPPTTQDRAATLLVTGSDFNYEQGVGAVDVGTYIAPDLYISYGIGLFDRENVISLRYDIARGFGIKATSGRSSEGVDLSYTIER